MKSQSIFIVLLFASLIFNGCNKVAESSQSNDSTTLIQDSIASSVKNNPQNVSTTKSNFDLLQGKWENVDNLGYFIVFEKDHWIDINDQGEVSSDKVFTISDNCINESDKGDPDPDRYINYSEDDEQWCYYIDVLDENNLTLVYAGNHSSYTKVKAGNNTPETSLLVAQDEGAEDNTPETSLQMAQDLVRFYGSNRKVGFKDINGNVVVEPKYDDVLNFGESYFNEGFAVVKLNNKYGYINRIGKEITPIKYSRAYAFNEGIARVCICKFSGNSNGINIDGDKWGAIDKKGNEAIPVKYDYLENLGSIVLIGDDGHWTKNAGVHEYKGKRGFIDKTGREVTPLKYDYVWMTDDDQGLIRVSVGGQWFEDGGQQPLYVAGSNMGNYVNNGKWGFVDKTGKEITPLKYDAIDVIGDRFSQGLYAVQLNGKYGYIDKTGKEIIPFKYDKVETFMSDRAQVRLGDRTFYIDKTGKEIN